MHFVITHKWLAAILLRLVMVRNTFTGSSASRNYRSFLRSGLILIIFTSNLYCRLFRNGNEVDFWIFDLNWCEDSEVWCCHRLLWSLRVWMSAACVGRWQLLEVGWHQHWSTTQPWTGIKSLYLWERLWLSMAICCSVSIWRNPLSVQSASLSSGDNTLSGYLTTSTCICVMCRQLLKLENIFSGIAIFISLNVRWLYLRWILLLFMWPDRLLSLWL